MTDEFNEYEAEAVRRAVYAITTGITQAASSVEPDGTLPADDDAAMKRLQKVLDALLDVYPVMRALASEYEEEP